MNQQEQIAAVGQALTLTTRIAETEEKLEELEGKTFRSKPLPPKQTTITDSYPEIKPDIPFWTKALLPALIFWPYLIIYYFTTHKRPRTPSTNGSKTPRNIKPGAVQWMKTGSADRQRQTSSIRRR